MLRKATSLILLLIAACLVTAAIAEASLPSVAVIRKLSAAELSGKTVEQAVWDRPVSIPRFEYYVCDYLPTQQTQVRLAYDDQNLYVAYTCQEDAMDRLSTKQTARDSSVWKDDAVGIDLDINHNHTTFRRLWSSASGVLSDQDFAKPGLRQGDDSWNPEWSVKTGRNQAGWTVLMTIPFKSLGAPTPNVGTTWGANLARRSAPAFERSCWTTCRPAIQDVERWGHFVFEGPDAPTIYIEQSEENRDAEFFPCRDRAGGNIGKAATPIAVPGKHSLTVKTYNPTSEPMPIRLVVLIDDKTTAKYSKTIPPGMSDWNLDFDFLYEGLHELRFAAYDASGNLLMRSSYQLVQIPEHTARLAKYRQIVASLKPKTASAKSEKADIESILVDLAVFARTARGSLANWNGLGAKLDSVSKRIGHLRCACADTAGRGYAVGTETALRKIMRDEMFEGEFGMPAKMSLAKNEFESVQVCVLAHDRPLNGVQVSVSELKGPSGATISTDSIMTNLVDFVDCKSPRYGADHYGWIPDPLMDPAPFDVAVGTLRPVWITVYTPKNTPAGTYRGVVSVKPADAPETKLPIEVKVWDFAVPTKMHAKTAFSFAEYELSAWYGKEVTREQRLQWYQFLLDHRISPTCIYSNTSVPTMEDIPFCAERGMNAFTLACTWYKNDGELDKMAVWMRDYEKFLKKNGWWDMPYIYGFDELGQDKFQELRDTYGGIKKRFPDLPTMTTIAPQPELKGYVDIWVPLTSNYVHDVAEQYRRDGDQVWWYVCCHPYHPYPNYFIDFNAVDPRVLWWMSWKENCPGILYYAINLWENNYKLEDKDAKPSNQWERDLVAGKRWPEIKWNTHTCATFNGDGQLIYPGPEGRPLSSIRLVSIRDGIEDFEYLYILDKLAKEAEKEPGSNKALINKAKALVAIRDDVVKSPSEYTTDPKLLLGARQEIAEMIEKLSK